MPDIKHLIQLTNTLPGTSSIVNESLILSPNDHDNETKYKKLRKWVDKQLSFTDGNRNQYVTKLTGSANRLAIDKTWLLAPLTQDFQESTFTGSEISGIVSSLYRNTSLHGISSFDDGKPNGPKEASQVTQETPAVDLMSKYDSIRISSLNPIPSPDPIISINEGVISTSGNLTVISGNSKSGKTSFCNVIIAGGIQHEESFYDGFDGVDIAVNKDLRAVIHIDTEQALHSHYKNYKSILRRARLDKDPDFFVSLNIRQVDMKKRRDLITSIFTDCAAKFDGIHLAVIDGAADLLSSVNDEEESNQLVHFLEKLAIEHNCPIITIVHFNPGSDKQRGHLGSQLQRKAESVLAIKKDGDNSYLEPQFLRNAGSGDIPSIAFSYDKEKGYHVYCGTRNIPDRAQDKTEKLKELADQAFKENPTQTHTGLVEKIMDLTQLQKTTAKDRIVQMLDLGILEKDMTNNYKIAGDPEPPF